jgi:hypothetical protein
MIAEVERCHPLWPSFTDCELKVEKIQANQSDPELELAVLDLLSQRSAQLVKDQFLMQRFVAVKNFAIFETLHLDISYGLNIHQLLRKPNHQPHAPPGTK